MEYTPSPKNPPSSPTTYELKKDVTGQPPPKRGMQTLIAHGQNEKKEQIKIPFKVPFPPKANCKKCNGRGYVGIDIKHGHIVPCRKCYPMM